MGNKLLSTVQLVLIPIGLLCLISAHAAAENGIDVKKPTRHVVQVPKRKDRSAETALWKLVKGSKSKAPFQLYIERYPKGFFVPAAKRQIRLLEAPKQRTIIHRKRSAPMIIAVDRLE